MPRLPVCALMLFALLTFQPALGQHRRKPVSGAKPRANPILRTLLGGMGSGQYSADTVRVLLQGGLGSVDQFSQTYPVVYFEFGLQSPDTSFNDSTGMPQPIEDYVSFPFFSNHLDTLWLPRVIAGLAPGDTLYFDHIIALDRAKKIRYGSPPMKITVR